MATTNKNFLAGVAASLGRLAGSVEGITEAITDAVHHKGEPHHDDTHFEVSDISGRNVFLVGLGVLVGTWVLTGLLYFYFAYLDHYRARVSPPPLPVAGRPEALPPGPRLQQSPPRDLKALRTREDWELNHYYWIDKASGTVAIPIEQAIRIIAERGIPPQKLPPNATLTPPQEGTRLTGFEGKVEPEPK
jgi:hypothetical protein